MTTKQIPNKTAEFPLGVNHCLYGNQLDTLLQRLGFGSQSIRAKIAETIAQRGFWESNGVSISKGVRAQGSKEEMLTFRHSSSDTGRDMARIFKMPRIINGRGIEIFFDVDRLECKPIYAGLQSVLVGGLPQSPARFTEKLFLGDIVSGGLKNTNCRVTVALTRGMAKADLRTHKNMQCDGSILAMQGTLVYVIYKQENCVKDPRIIVKVHLPSSLIQRDEIAKFENSVSVLHQAILFGGIEAEKK